jgi:hypothetical protein
MLGVESHSHGDAAGLRRRPRCATGRSVEGVFESALRLLTGAAVAAGQHGGMG